ncbi:MAG: response regulator [Anaerolineales bacterium]
MSNSLNRTILMIDDNHTVQENVHDILKFEGHHVLRAHNGETGLTIARAHYIDLVLCDIMMPGINGYEVLRQLRTYPPLKRVPFVIISSKSTQEDIEYGLELGVDAYVPKPFTADELLSAVNQALARAER